METEKVQKQQASVAEWLTELSAEDREGARGEIEWAKMFIALYRPGDFHTIPHGVTFQAISFDTVRCVRIFDSPRAWWWLSMLKVSFEEADITLELDPYTIVTRYPERAEGKVSQPTESTPEAPESSTKPGAVNVRAAENFGVEVV